MKFDKLIASKSPHKVFTYDDGAQPVDLNKIFARLLRKMEIEYSAIGINRTIYSLRHSYAIFELLSSTDTHDCQANGNFCSNVSRASLQQVDGDYGN